MSHALPPSETGRIEPRNRAILTALFISAFLVGLNETLLGVALPDIMQSLDIQASTGQWLTTIYMLVMAVVVPLSGTLLQRFSARAILLAAMLTFSLGTLCGALAPGFPMLLAGRVLQAAGTALMMPLTMTAVMTLVPEASRGRVMGTVSVVMSLAPALGPALSGLVLGVFGWHALFWIVLPIAVVVTGIGYTLMRDAPHGRRVPLDGPSVLLSSLAFGGLVWGLGTFARAARGEALVSPWLPLAVGLVLGAAFVGRQVRLARAERALLDLRPFLSPAFRTSVLLMAAAMVMLFGIGFLLPLYAQQVLGLSPMLTGLYLLPGSLFLGLMGPVVGSLYDRHGARPLLIPGTVVTSAAAWFMAALTPASPAWFILAANLALGLGLAFMMTPLFTLAMSSAPAHLTAHCSALVGTTQQLAGAAGTALFVGVLTWVQLREGAAGAAAGAANAAGLQAAFLCGAVLSLGTVALAIVLRPAARAAAAPTGPIH